MVEMVNRPYATAFEKFAGGNPDILCLSADLTSSCEIDGFRDRYPDQFLSMGMAEQNMMSFAARPRIGRFPPLHPHVRRLHVSSTLRPTGRLDRLSATRCSLDGVSAWRDDAWRLDPPIHRRHQCHAVDPQHDHYRHRRCDRGGEHLPSRGFDRRGRSGAGCLARGQCPGLFRDTRSACREMRLLFEGRMSWW